jgi:hypothetical protein
MDWDECVEAVVGLNRCESCSAVSLAAAAEVSGSDVVTLIWRVEAVTLSREALCAQ